MLVNRAFALLWVRRTRRLWMQMLQVLRLQALLLIFIRRIIEIQTGFREPDAPSFHVRRFRQNE